MASIRSITQARPKGTDGPAYSPQRDLAYIYAPAMREAMAGLDEANWSPEIRKLVGDAGLTEESLGRAVGCLMEAHRKFLNTEYRDADAALQASGWYNVPAAVRYLIYGRLGEVLLGGFFIALRDVTPVGGKPPTASDLAEMLAAGEMIVAREAGARRDPTRTEELLMEVAAAREEKRMADHALTEADERHTADTKQLLSNRVTKVSLWRLLQELLARLVGSRLARWLRLPR